ncbi:MAG: hypothetical protein ACYDG2_21880 [Ruminiclostridium sp.]
MFKKAIVILVLVCVIGSTSSVCFAQESSQAAENSNSNVMKPNWKEISMFSNNFDISDSGLATVNHYFMRLV